MPAKPPDSPAADDALLTAADVADRLRIARSTVYELSRTGELPSIVLSRGLRRAGVRRWHARDVDAFVERCREGGGEQAPSWTSAEADEAPLRGSGRERLRGPQARRASR